MEYHADYVQALDIESPDYPTITPLGYIETQPFTQVTEHYSDAEGHWTTEREYDGEVAIATGFRYDFESGVTVTAHFKPLTLGYLNDIDWHAFHKAVEAQTSPAFLGRVLDQWEAR